MTASTKEAMADALASLLKTKSISKITVQDIVDKCGVNRQTFYYHFSDIYALLEYALDCQIKKRIDNKEFENYDFKELSIYFKTIITKQRSYVLNAYDIRNHVYYEKFLKKQFYPSVYKMIENIDEAKYVSKIDLDFIANSLTKLIVGLFMEWIANGAPNNDMDDQEKLSLIFNDEALKNILIRFANYNS